MYPISQYIGDNMSGDVKTKEVSESDWTGSLSLIWMVSFLLMCGYSVYNMNMEMLEKLVALLGGYTLLVLKFYYDRKTL